jgi:RNA polymerase sigma-70 factor (ECF subfamily)
MIDQEADLRCIERIADGQSQALEELYDRYAPLVFSVVRKILRREEDAEEALQDTWLQLWRKPHAYDPKRGSVAAWLVTVGRSRALDLYRNRASRQRAEEAQPSDDPAPIENPSTSVEDRDLRERMAAGWQSLEPQHRQVLELAFWGGLSQSEIAERTGSPLGTVKSWMRQGMKRLSDSFQKEEWR